MKKVLKVVVNIAAWVIVFLALLVTILVFSSGNSSGVPNLLGYIPLTVESDSMSPTFKTGDLIISKQIDDIAALNQGDVITFWTIIDGQKVKNTHRIVNVNESDGVRSFVTRGDNNPIDDESQVYAGDIIGKWTETKLSGAGTAMAFL
ncbi:MAG: signal peptidase I, partial [Oscillospiraceae bacterium]|nr:signal peptidase I [Oscillospiraceae bacterium]